MHCGLNMGRAALKRDYQENGYIYVPRMLSEAEVATYKSAIDKVFPSRD